MATAALVLPALARADAPPPAAGPAPAPMPAPVPQPGHARLAIAQALHLHGRAYVVAGQRVVVTGRVHPYVPGQVLGVRIRAARGGSALVHARVREGGAFRVVFRAHRALAYRVVVRHDATPEQAAFRALIGVVAISGRSAGPGTRGVRIELLKQGLRALGYPAGSGSSWTDKLGREVLAFRKVNRMARISTANRQIFAMVVAGRGAFVLRHPDAAKHVEFDWSRQVLVLANGAKPVAVYHASSGKPSTPTVFGTFHFYMKAAGTNAKGMFMSNYFVRGYAVHGYPDVPTYAASHGCIRVPNADAMAIWNQISLGETIFVYR